MGKGGGGVVRYTLYSHAASDTLQNHNGITYILYIHGLEVLGQVLLRPADIIHSPFTGVAEDLIGGTYTFKRFSSGIISGISIWVISIISNRHLLLCGENGKV